ncbi:hypothetical protein K439DRAFT_1646340 [Ramaria rubella]|nr:hypothetical protein K439DRAFT_1646340 [Ramaria rubella]
MCPNLCMAYTGPYSELEECPYEVCGESCWDTFQLKMSWGKIKVPAKRFSTMPIGPQLQALWRSPKTTAQLNYRRIDTYEDILQGQEYLDAVRRGDINEYDTVVMFRIDSAQLYQGKQSDCWIYIWIVIDFALDVRYKKMCVLPGGVLPGPHKPKHMDSFLFLGFHHVAAIQKEGLQIWNSIDGSLRNSNIYFLLGEWYSAYI